MAYITFTMFMCYFLSLSTLDSNSEKSHTGSNLRLDFKKKLIQKKVLKKKEFVRKNKFMQKKVFFFMLFICSIHFASQTFMARFVSFTPSTSFHLPLGSYDRCLLWCKEKWIQAKMGIIKGSWICSYFTI